MEGPEDLQEDRAAAGKAFGISVLVFILAVAGGLVMPSLPIPRADLTTAGCGEANASGQLAVFILWGLGWAGVASLIAYGLAPSLGPSGQPEVRLGFHGVLLAGTAAAVFDAHTLANFAEACGALVPVGDYALALIPALLAAALVGLRPRGAAATGAFLAMTPVVSLQAAGWTLYYDGEAGDGIDAVVYFSALPVGVSLLLALHLVISRLPWQVR